MEARDYTGVKAGGGLILFSRQLDNRVEGAEGYGAVKTHVHM